MIVKLSPGLNNSTEILNTLVTSARPIGKERNARLNRITIWHVQPRSTEMTDCRTMLANLRRPRLLMRAARFGLGDYRRDRDLRRIVSGGASPEDTVSSLISVEAKLEATRLAGDVAYSVGRHVEVLIAILAEAQLLRRSEIV